MGVNAKFQPIFSILAGDPNLYPGPIDNSPLFDNGNLRKYMLENLHYNSVPAEAWDVLLKLFGMEEGQSPVARKVSCLYCGLR